MYLGKNLNKSIVLSTCGTRLAVLDGRETRNPAAQVHVAPGVYVIEKEMGAAPDEVWYYGAPINRTYHADTSIPNTRHQAFTIHQGYTLVWVETDPSTKGGILTDPRAPEDAQHIPCARKAPLWVHFGAVDMPRIG